MPDIPVAEPSARYATVHANFATHQGLAGLPALVTSGVVLFTPSCVAHDETTIFTPCAVRGFWLMASSAPIHVVVRRESSCWLLPTTR